MADYYYPDGTYAGNKPPEGAKVVKFNRWKHNLPKGPKGLDLDSLLPWLIAGGAGLAAHTAASSMMEGDEKENKKKSAWQKALAALIPVGVGAAAGYGGYSLGKMLKQSQDNSDNSVVYMGEEAQKQYEGQPWVRIGLGTGGLLGTAKASGKAMSELVSAREMPKMVDPPLSTRIQGSIEAQEAAEALKARRKSLEKYVKEHPVESRTALVDTSAEKAIERRRAEALKKTYTQVPNAERIAALKRAKRWGIGAVLGALLTIPSIWSAWDHYNMADKIEKGRNGEY